jgi:serine/threonine kinase PknH
VGIFISYSSQDRSSIDDLLVALHKTKKPVWFDEELAGGEAWWRVILDKIRTCEVFLVAVSNHSLDSKPCQAELAYAQALHRPILPIQIGPIDSMRANPLAAVQLIDYRTPTVESGIQLVTAVHDLWEKRPPLPSPLPEEPPVPFEYLLRLARALEDSDLSAQQQTQLLSELKSALEEDGQDPVVRRDITRLLVILRNRNDVSWKTRTDVDKLLTSINEPAAGDFREAAAATQAGQPATEAGQPTAQTGQQPTYQTGQPPYQTAQQPTYQTGQPPYQAGQQPTYQTGQPSYHTNQPTYHTPPPPQGPPAGPMPLMGPHPTPPPGAGTPYGQTKKKKSRTPWIIAGVGGLAALATIVIVVALASSSSTPPPPEKLVPMDQSHLDSILLTADQVNTIMDVTGMQASGQEPEHELLDTAFGAALANQDCRGALLPAQTPVYQPSGYVGVSTQVVEDPTQSPDHVVILSAIGYPSVDKARDFMNTSTTKWQSCAGKFVAVNEPGKAASGWDFGTLTGADPKLSQLDTQEGQSGWQCERALSRTANLVVDVAACGYHITDQADRIAAKMVANAAS